MGIGRLLRRLALLAIPFRPPCIVGVPRREKTAATTPPYDFFGNLPKSREATIALRERVCVCVCGSRLMQDEDEGGDARLLLFHAKLRLARSERSAIVVEGKQAKQGG